MEVKDKFSGDMVPVKNGLGGDATGCIEFALWRQFSHTNLKVGDCIQLADVVRCAGEAPKVTTCRNSKIEVYFYFNLFEMTYKIKKKSLINIY